MGARARSRASRSATASATRARPALGRLQGPCVPPLVLLLISFAVILAGALLFTNAVEWMGHRLAMGQGAVGSLLAAVGTAMPETLIPIVAIVGGAEGAEEVAVGAIIGAPFLLATIAMGLVGVSAFIYKDRREQGTELRAHGPTLRRDLRFFLDLLRARHRRRRGAASDLGADPARGPLHRRVRHLRPAHPPRGRRRPGGRGHRPADPRPHAAPGTIPSST